MLIDPVTGDCVVDVLSTLPVALFNQQINTHGYVKILDVMPRLVPAAFPTCDGALADAARVSYAGGTRKVSNDTALIDNLIRNKHTSPIEMGELKFALRMPIFCMRQFVRHRTASMNEESARYSVLADDFYIPEAGDWSINTAADKQATQTVKVDDAAVLKLTMLLTEQAAKSYDLYTSLLDGTALDESGDILKVSREQARMVLGTNIYTSCVWKCDLKNLLHLLMLRCDVHTQRELRVYADAMARVVSHCFPAAFASFKDNFMDGINLSKSEAVLLFNRNPLALFSDAEIQDKTGWSLRRVAEFRAKISKVAPSA